MSIKTFIDRPILSGVISVAIVIVGLIGLSQLPIEQFPDIAPPTVRVSATYTGANAETVMKSVITPLEEQLNGVENMMYMTSTATNTGFASISVYFKQGTDPDMSVVNVQNRVASAQGLLPAEVTKSGITVRKRQSNSLKAISLYSPDGSHDANFLTNYMKINIEPRLSRIAGVGDVNSVMNDIYRRTDGIKAATIRVSTSPMISGYGMNNGFDLYVQDKKGGSVDDLLKYTNNFINEMNKRPEISRAYTTFDTKYPQYMVEVDATCASATTYRQQMCSIRWQVMWAAATPAISIASPSSTV